MPDLVSDIIGRVRRLPLSPSETNALLPLHEAFSNSLHAVRDRFKENAVRDGRIEITIEREGELVKGFIIEDNGIGFNDENYKSFLTPDSQRKIGLGGKGVGRLSWLRVFGGARISSRYLNDGALKRRDFDFVLDKEDQVRNPKIEDVQDGGEPGTMVHLEQFSSGYAQRCPTKAETIVQRLVAHFLPTLASNACPHAVVFDGSDTFDLRSYFQDKIIEKTSVEVVLQSEDQENGEGDDAGTETLQLLHMKCDKSIRLRGARYNWMFLCAHERSVTEQCIDDQIGLRSLEDEAIYIGCASGDYLDRHVNQERDGFTFSSVEETEIRRRLADAVREYLSDYVAQNRAMMVKASQQLISENPQFLPIMEEINDFVKTLAPNAANKPEEIYVSMARHRYRKQREFKKVSSEIAEPQDHDEAISEKVQEYLKYIDLEKKGALAEYVTKRKAILDFFDKLTQYEDPEKRKHHLEDAVHSLICPMKVDSSQISVDDHNLWLLDDRLSFFNFFASDKEARQYIETESRDRPDLAFLYDSCLAWREGGQHSDKVVIVEFKAPARDNYDKEDPVRQALRYVDLMKSSPNFKDKDGRIISNVSDMTSFDCYIIADLTRGLKKQLIGLPLQSTPDGQGMFGYTDNPRAYVEIIPFSKLLNDAKARNSAFFATLGLNG